MADDKTIKEVWDSFTEDQKTVVKFMVNEALEEGKRIARNERFLHSSWESLVHDVLER